MISTMRPDIDNMDEYVRNTTARAFAVVASALGIPSLLPFLKAVCRSKKSWQARHTGIKIVQQIAILMGCAILPHLKNLVEIIEHGECVHSFIHSFIHSLIHLIIHSFSLGQFKLVFNLLRQSSSHVLSLTKSDIKISSDEFPRKQKLSILIYAIKVFS